MLVRPSTDIQTSIASQIENSGKTQTTSIDTAAAANLIGPREVERMHYEKSREHRASAAGSIQPEYSINLTAEDKVSGLNINQILNVRNKAL